MGFAKYDAARQRFTLTAEARHVLHELREQTERGLGVLGGALVDDAISLATGRPEKEQFANKISIAAKTGLIGPTVKADLDLIREVRNAFAHLVRVKGDKYNPISFDTKVPKANCLKLALIDTVEVFFNGRRLPTSSAKDRYLATCMMMSAALRLFAGNRLKKKKEIDTILKA